MAEMIDNTSRREAAFRVLLRSLLSGEGSVALVREYQQWIDDSRPADLVRVVDQAVAEGVAFSELKPAVAKLINLMHKALSRYRYLPDGHDHFLKALMEANSGLRSLLEEGKIIAARLGEGVPAAAWQRAAGELGQWLVRLRAHETQFRRKENILFPRFEALYPEYRCVRLMWEIHDDIRQGWKQLGHLLADRPAQPDAESRRELHRVLGRLYFDLNTNIFREEHALFPVIGPLLDRTTQAEMFLEADEMGWPLVPDVVQATLRSAARQDLNPSEAGAGIPSAAKSTEAMPCYASAEKDSQSRTGFAGRTGSLPPDVLEALFRTIHLDMTWVDADDKVRWFSDSPKRIFPRSPSIIGRDVRNCHPGSSIGRVTAIIESFRSGRKDHESFWLSRSGRFIHIEYFALRDPDGTYLGTLEASEDLTDKRSLQGEKRLAE